MFSQRLQNGTEEKYKKSATSMSNINLKSGTPSNTTRRLEAQPRKYYALYDLPYA